MEIEKINEKFNNVMELLKSNNENNEYKEAFHILNELYEQTPSLDTKLEIAKCYCFGKGTVVDGDKAYELFSEIYEQQKDIVSRFYIAQCYYFGKGVSKNYEKAFELCNQNDIQEDRSIENRYLLGLCYLYGKGVEKDQQKAFHIFEDGVKELNDIACKEQIAKCYYYGDGVVQDFNKAFELFNEMIEDLKKSSPTLKEIETTAIYFIGVCYYNGYGVEKNLEKAVEIFDKLVFERDDKYAREKLEKCLIEYNDIEEIKKILEKYEKRLREDPKLQILLLVAFMYKNGVGTQKDIPIANELYLIANNSENDDASFKIGYAYFKGEGVEPNDEKAVDWLEQACKEGSVKAKYILGIICLDGEKNGFKIKEDKEKGSKLLIESAQAGYEKAKEECKNRNIQY